MLHRLWLYWRCRYMLWWLRRNGHKLILDNFGISAARIQQGIDKYREERAWSGFTLRLWLTGKR